MGVETGLRWILVLSIFVLSTFLFHLAAGSLSLKRLNLISYAYYSFLGFTLLGASLAFLGFREHYLFVKITEEWVYRKGYILIALTAILLPLMMLLAQKVLNFWKKAPHFNDYVHQPLQDVRMHENGYWILVGLLLLCIAVMAAFYVNVGQIPLQGWLLGGDPKERQILTKVAYIHPYLKNFLMLLLPMYFSFYAYFMMRTTKTWRWRVLFFAYFIYVVLAKMYNYEKYPVLEYLILFLIAEVLLGNVKSLKGPLLLGVVVVGLIALMYTVIFQYEGRLFNIYAGPLGRILFSQIAALFFSVKFFPRKVPYLRGASLPTALAVLVGAPGAWRRSARVIMELVNPVGVKAGTAGVMNSLFVSESYVNWGMWGAIFGILYVGVLFGLAQGIFLRLKKTPLSLVFYIALIQAMIPPLNAGFVDYLYNTGFVVILLVIWILSVGARQRTSQRQKPQWMSKNEIENWNEGE